MRFIYRFRCIDIFLLCSFILLCIGFTPICASGDSALRVGVSQYNPPFSIVEQGESSSRGFSIDLAKLLADNIGLTVEIYPMNDSELVKALNSGRIDLVVGVMDESYSSAEVIKTSIEVNKSYFVNRQILTINSYKDLPGHTMAIEKGRNLSWLLPPQPNIHFIETGSQREALALVDSGKADVYVSNNNIATIYTVQKGFRNIKEVGTPIETVPLVLAVDKNRPALLTSLSIAYGKILENKSYKAVYYKWFGNDFRYFLTYYFKYFVGAILFVTVALLLSVIWNFTLKRKVLHVTKDLQLSEQKYRDLIEFSPDMIHLISLMGEVRLANKIALEQLGYNESEMISIRLHDLVIPEQKDDVNVFIETVFRHKYSHKEFTFRTKDGKSVHVEMVAAIVKGPDEEAALVCCFARDITERKRLEENLIHSDRLAIMGQMAAGIAHEINNPLGIILSNAQDVLNYGQHNKESNESLKSIERNALRAAKIIEGLLSFTRPTLQEIESIDLIQLIDETLLFFKQRLRQKNIRIEKSYPDGLMSLWGDKKLIQQLLINLILNSIHAIKNGGVITIRINMAGEAAEKKLVLQVEDNGVGIPPEDLKKIFNPFFTSRKEDGFGLGLFISKIIVEKHHGNLSASSNVGKGTVMSAGFPVEEASAFSSYKLVNREK
jgi:PAS domain S-box-containing protein